MTTLQYSIATDFLNATQVYSPGLIQLVNAVSPIDSMNVNGDAVVMFFPAVLSGGQTSSVTAIVNAYVYVAPPAITASTVYSAVVSNTPFADADYTSIAAAFAAGATSVFVRNGTYTETANIIIPSQGSLLGEAPGRVIINFSGSFGIRADGNLGVKQNAGTVSITANTGTVTGVGTSFTSLAPGNFIMLGSTYHIITVITSNTQLSILGVHRVTITNAPYQALAMQLGTRIENITVGSSTTSGLFLRAVAFSSFQRVVVQNASQGISLVDCNGVVASKVIAATLATSGLSLDNCISTMFTECVTTRAGTDGVVTSGALSYDVKLSSFVSKNNGANGFNIGDVGVTLDACGSEDNLTNGVLCAGNGCAVMDCSIRANGQAGVSAIGTNTNIHSTSCSANGTHGISLAGNSSSVVGCMISSNTNDGVNVNANNCIVSSSQINANANGVVISNTSNNTIVAANNLLSNSATNLSDSGIASVLSANVS